MALTSRTKYSRTQVLQVHEAITPDRNTCQEYGSLKKVFISWLPKDSNTFLFELMVGVILIVGVFDFYRTGNTSMLIALLPYVATYAGLPRVKSLLAWVKEGLITDNQHETR